MTPEHHKRHEEKNKTHKIILELNEHNNYEKERAPLA